MKITYEGHSCFSLDCCGTSILIDPYISDNPLRAKAPEDFSPHLILVSHGHGDHLGDTLAIARRAAATLAAQADLLRVLDTQGIPTISFNTGGSIRFRGIKITMTAAWHGSTVQVDGRNYYSGVACGFIIDDGERRLYHAGDTALFGDMQTVLSRYNLDCALLPIGDYYTMGPEDALTAAEWLRAKLVIPMHYDTFPVIRQDASAFARSVEEKTPSRSQALAIGEAIEI